MLSSNNLADIVNWLLEKINELKDTLEKEMLRKIKSNIFSKLFPEEIKMLSQLTILLNLLDADFIGKSDFAKLAELSELSKLEGLEKLSDLKKLEDLKK